MVESLGYIDEEVIKIVQIDLATSTMIYNYTWDQSCNGILTSATVESIKARDDGLLDIIYRCPEDTININKGENQTHLVYDLALF